ncbi:hypothetical protein PR048_002869 [Dryococelus australis]|uniref:Uncharacterized protein n=1 Tax=Dryococelus australis TaxID=614101 RepID=A0ABQ9ILI9_9NEOP|nr:hypothetical protein PR048_002869 [Dryococelus australis]
MRRQGKPEIPEKTRRSVVSSGTIPTCESPRVTRPGIEPQFTLYPIEPRCCNGLTIRPPPPPGRTGFDYQRSRSQIFASGNRAERCRWSTGFLGDFPFPPPLHSGAAPYSLQPPSSALKTSLTAVQISPLHLFTPRPAEPVGLKASDVYAQKGLRGIQEATSIEVEGVKKGCPGDLNQERRQDSDLRLFRAESQRVKGAVPTPSSPNLFLQPVELVGWAPVRTPRPRSRSEGAIRATLTRTPSASSLLRAWHRQQMMFEKGVKTVIVVKGGGGAIQGLASLTCIVTPDSGAECNAVGNWSTPENFTTTAISAAFPTRDNTGVNTPGWQEYRDNLKFMLYQCKTSEFYSLMYIARQVNYVALEHTLTLVDHDNKRTRKGKAQRYPSYSPLRTVNSTLALTKGSVVSVNLVLMKAVYAPTKQTVEKPPPLPPPQGTIQPARLKDEIRARNKPRIRTTMHNNPSLACRVVLQNISRVRILPTFADCVRSMNPRFVNTNHRIGVGQCWVHAQKTSKWCTSSRLANIVRIKSHHCRSCDFDSCVGSG